MTSGKTIVLPLLAFVTACSTPPSDKFEKSVQEISQKDTTLTDEFVSGCAVALSVKIDQILVRGPKTDSAEALQDWFAEGKNLYPARDFYLVKASTVPMTLEKDVPSPDTCISTYNNTKARLDI